LLSLCAPIQGTARPQPYALDGTEVQCIQSKILNRDYELYFGLPASYGKSPRRYPVVFITDAPYAFPLVRSISRRVSDNGKQLEEFILVGLSYAKGDTSALSRNRDYTPTDVNAKGTREPDQAIGPYGQAERYRRFIADEVFPFVARHYPADMSRTIYFGHSYGGLFGIHVLLTKPTMFSHYVIGSPSLWFDKRHMLKAERAYAATSRDLPARILMIVGSFETIPSQTSNPRFHKRNDMIKDARVFEMQLKARHYPSLSIRSEVIDDEDHLTVFPAIATRGLLWALPAR